MPPAAGPMLRIRLNPMLLSDTADDNSSRETMSPMEACHDGLCSAVPQPIMKVKTKSNQGVNQPSYAMKASRIDTTSMKDCAMSITLRRSKLSAKTPASSEKITIGGVTEDCTSATMLCDLLSDVIIQAAPTNCTSPPKFDANAAIQSMRNVWFRNRNNVDVLCGTNHPFQPRKLCGNLAAWARHPGARVLGIKDRGAALQKKRGSSDEGL